MVNRGFILCVLLMGPALAADAPTATDIVRAAIDHWRGLSSYTEMSMVIHRPDWERSMTIMVSKHAEN